ncbi:MAG: recombinase family protein [Clostridiaceae bacterium]|jgi:DNA invertase Pin-like site-specific DNA recombinase|nr:recombinase family protein [Clostridiaceae bacterium]
MELEQAKPRAVLLYRASSKKQTDSENDIPLQRNILKPWAERNGWVFVCEKVEGGVSGFKVSANDRDKIQEIKAMAERREFDILGIYMSDRLGRIAEETPLIVSYLNARGIKVISYREGEITTNTHTDKLMTYIRYWQAQGESMKTSARCCDALIDNVRNGRWRGGMPPFGYKSISRGTLNYKGKPILDVEIDTEASEAVKLMFSLYGKEHYGTRLIAKHLNDKGIETPQKTLWNASLVSKVLRCKTYIGIYQLHKQVKSKPLVESPRMEHLRIISDEEFYEVQRLLRVNNNNPDREYSPTRHGQLLLTGLLYCGQCGEKITSFYNIKATERNKPEGERQKTYLYRCRGYMKPLSSRPNCKPSMWTAEIVDQAVIADAKNFILTIDREKLLSGYETTAKERLKAASDKMKKAEAQAVQIEKEVKKLKDEIMKTILGESKFSQDLLNEMLANKTAEWSGATEARASAELELHAAEEEIARQKTVCAELDTWSEKFERQEQSGKKAMLLNIIDRVTIRADRIEISYKIKLDELTATKPTRQSLIFDDVDTTPIDCPELQQQGVKRYALPRLRTPTCRIFKLHRKKAFGAVLFKRLSKEVCGKCVAATNLTLLRGLAMLACPNRIHPIRVRRTNALFCFLRFRTRTPPKTMSRRHLEHFIRTKSVFLQSPSRR